MQQNRQDFILKTLNDALRADDRFDVVTTWSEGSARSTERVTVYLYVFEERALSFTEYEDLTIDNNRKMLTRVGIRFSFSAKRDTQNAAMTRIVTDSIARVEYLLRTLDLTSEASDDFGATTSIKSAVLEYSSGYYDDRRTNGDTEGIIAVVSVTTA